MKTLAFLNNKGGVGKTSLAYHLAWMFSDLGVPVLAADLDPQSNLTAAFLDSEQIEALWDSPEERKTVWGAVQPLITGTGDLAEIWFQQISDNLWLLPGHLNLSEFEDELSLEWARCLDGKERSFRVLSAFHRILLAASDHLSAGIVIIDVGPNLGAINRAVMIAADNVLVPLAPDLFSLQGLKNLGPTLRQWRAEWSERLQKADEKKVDLDLPHGYMAPIGYVVLQHTVRLDRPVRSFGRWIERIPSLFSEVVLGSSEVVSLSIHEDPHCLGLLKNYQSLMPMAQEARKPIFHLTAADGAFGGHEKAVQTCRADFMKLAKNIAQRCLIDLPE